jgi:hypothetical protein
VKRQEYSSQSEKASEKVKAKPVKKSVKRQDYSSESEKAYEKV